MHPWLSLYTSTHSLEKCPKGTVALSGGPGVPWRPFLSQGQNIESHVQALRVYYMASFCCVLTLYVFFLSKLYIICNKYILTNYPACINRNVLPVGTSGDGLQGKRNGQDWNFGNLGPQYSSCSLDWLNGFGQVTNSPFPFTSSFTT